MSSSPHCTFPHLFLSDETTDSLEERSNQIVDIESAGFPGDTRDNVPEPKSVTYIDHEDPFSLIDQSSGAPHIRSLSSNAWVGCGDDIYVLECMGKGFIRIEPAHSEGDIPFPTNQPSRG